MARSTVVIERIAAVLDKDAWAHDLDQLDPSRKIELGHRRLQAAEKARRILEVMRDPNDAMIEVGQVEVHDQLRWAVKRCISLAKENDNEYWITRECEQDIKPTKIFRAMIDAALKQ